MAWWKFYDRQIRQSFRGDLVGAAINWPGVEKHPVPAYLNSGCGAVSLAASRGAKRVILVGYDCKKSGGNVHHHGDHPPSLGNAKSMSKWFPRFDKLAADMKRLRVEVLNASRETALTCFPRIDLETALADRDHAGTE